jgi:hypothetical protein
MADNIVERKFNFSGARGQIANRQELENQLSELGGLIWQAIQASDEITEAVFELADAKLFLDKVHPEGKDPR